VKQGFVTSYMLFTREFSKKIAFGYIPKKEESNGYSIIHFFASDPRILPKNIEKSKLKKILTMVDGGFNMDKISDMNRYVKLINNEINIVVVETNKQKKLAESIGISIPIKIIPFGVDTDIFKPKPIPSQPFRLLFASSPIKKDQLSSRGISLMLSALAKVQKDIRLTYVTREGLSKEIKELILKNKVSDSIDLLTGDQNMPEIFAEHHACIIPYTSHYGVMDLPHTALESLATGRPVVSTDVIGLSFYLDKHNCGTVSTATSVDLIESINELFNNYKIYQENCRDTAKQYFSQNRFILNYGDIYKEVIIE
jgi:glycosyltransferase involved in cell wall biosynthesis